MTVVLAAVLSLQLPSPPFPRGTALTGASNGPFAYFKEEGEDEVNVDDINYNNTDNETDKKRPTKKQTVKKKKI